MGERPVYGKPKPQHSAMMAGMWYESDAQARLLQRVLELGMREFAGKHEETFLAKCFNDVEKTRARAKRENWNGWDEEDHPAIVGEGKINE